MPRPRRPFVLALALVLISLVVCLIGNQLLGNEMGAPCADSYRCRGFLFSGVECVDVDGHSYCTTYCDDDDDCPSGWVCKSATPTVLAVETDTLDEVCVKRD